MGNVVAVFMYSLISDHSLIKTAMSLYMHVGKNIGTGMIVLLPSVNTLRFYIREIPTFSFLH